MGLISTHHDSFSSEKLLKYLYLCLQANSTPIALEVNPTVTQRIVGNIVDDLWVSNDRTTIFRPLKLQLPQNAELNSFLLKGLEPIEIKTSAKVPCIPVVYALYKVDFFEEALQDDES